VAIQLPDIVARLRLDDSDLDKGADRVKTSLEKVGTGVAVVSGVLTGVGGAITVTGEKLADAERTLQRVIENGGFAYDDYRGKIDDAIDSMAKFGHNSTEVQSVLATLTLKFKDPAVALDALSLAADIAATKNISLADAGAIVSKAMSGNAKVLKGFGISVESSKKATEAAEKATTSHAGAQEKLTTVTQDLADMQAILTEKQQVSASDTRALKKATEDLAAARKSGDPEAIAAAEERLAVVQERIAASASLSVSEQQRLRDAQKEVADAAADLTLKTENMNAAQAHAQEAAGASTKAIDELRKKVGGMAKEESETFRGKLEGIKTELGNVAADLGKKFGPALTVASGALTVAGGVMANYTALVEGIPALTKLWTLAQAAFNLVMSANPIVLVALAIAALVAGIIIAYKNCETFREIVDAVFRFLKDVVTGAIDWIKKNWDLILPILLGPVGLAILIWKRFGDDIKDAIGAAFQWIKDRFNDIVDFVGGLPGKIGRAASGMWDGIKDAFKAVINWIIRGWNSLKFEIPGFDPPGPIGEIGGFTLGVPPIKPLEFGGPVLPGMPYIVGEKRPELFVPDVRGTVLPSVPSGDIILNSSLVVQGGISDEESFRRILDARDRELVSTLRAGFR
jgi:hypothetical protein